MADKRLRILEVIASSERGGAERVLGSLIKGLDRTRFDVRVACHGTGPMMDEYRRLSTDVVSVACAGHSYLGAIGPLVRLIRRMRCDIVHTHLWSADLLGGLAAAIAGVPVRVATVHGGYFQTQEGDAGLRVLRKTALSRMYRGVYGMFDRVITVCNAVRDDLIRRQGIGVPPRKAVVIHNGLDVFRLEEARIDSWSRETFGLSQSDRLVTTVAHFFPYKGHQWLIEALPAVLRRHPDVVGVLVGSGPLLERMRDLAHRLHISDRVIFAGDRSDALRIMSASDVVVLPSVSSEGLPMVLLEALALGKSVVATTVGGVPELVANGETGLLVPPRDAEKLGQAISCMLSNPAMAMKLGENGRQTVQSQFMADRMVSRVQDLYLDLWAEKTRRSG